jgi:general secretion pathway protein G
MMAASLDAREHLWDIKRVRILTSDIRVLRNSKAFTLIELLAVLVILALVVGLAAPQIINQLEGGKANAAKTEIAGIEQALQAFYLDCGYFPKTEPGLQALIDKSAAGERCSKSFKEGGYLKKRELPQDPWDELYIYVSPGQQNPAGFDLSSKGRDGELGTEDDINNW